MIDLKDRLRVLRESRGYKTQKQFCSHAKKYGYVIDVVRYGRIERGEVKPNIEEIWTICKAMEITADAWIFGRVPRVDVRWLTDHEVGIVNELVKGLLSRQ